MRLLPALYDFQMRLVAERIEPLRRRVVAEATGRVLEIGIGTGLNLPHYRAGVRLAAVDPDLAMLKRAAPRAKESAAQVYLVVAAAEALPFRDGAFDAATATLVFCSVRSPRPRSPRRGASSAPAATYASSSTCAARVKGGRASRTR